MKMDSRPIIAITMGDAAEERDLINQCQVIFCEQATQLLSGQKAGCLPC